MNAVRLLIGAVLGDAGGNGALPRDQEPFLDLEVDHVRCILRNGTKAAASHPPAQALTPREEQVARMVAAGYPNKSIAVMLGLSTWTVSTYLRRIFAKFDVHSRAAMVARLLEDRLAEPVPNAAELADVAPFWLMPRDALSPVDAGDRSPLARRGSVAGRDEGRTRW